MAILSELPTVIEMQSGSHRVERQMGGTPIETPHATEEDEEEAIELAALRSEERKHRLAFFRARHDKSLTAESMDSITRIRKRIVPVISAVCMCLFILLMLFSVLYKTFNPEKANPVNAETLQALLSLAGGGGPGVSGFPLIGALGEKAGAPNPSPPPGDSTTRRPLSQQ